MEFIPNNGSACFRHFEQKDRQEESAVNRQAVVFFYYEHQPALHYFTV